MGAYCALALLPSRLGKQCCRACRWAFALGCTMLHEVAFTVNAVDDLFGREAGVIHHAMDLQLYMFQLATKGVDQHDGFEFAPVNVTHVGDTCNEVVNLVDG